MADNPVTEIEIKQISTELTPVNRVESALSDFVKDTFSMVNEDYIFNRELRKELLAKMANSELTPAQLVMLYTTDSVNISDRMSKTLSPLMQLLTAKQQAEMAKIQKETASIQSDAESINRIIPNDVNRGLQALADLVRGLPPREPEIQISPSSSQPHLPSQEE